MAIKTVGEEIQSIRLQKGITVEQLAAGIYSERNLSRILSGNSRGTQEIIEKLMERLDINTDLTYGSKFKCKENFKWFYLFLQVRFFLENGHIKDAVSLLSEGISTIAIINEEDYCEYLILFGRIHFLLGNYDTAVSSFKRALKISASRFEDLEIELQLLLDVLDTSRFTVSDIQNQYEFFLDSFDNIENLELKSSLKNDLFFFVGQKFYNNGFYKEAFDILSEHEKDSGESIKLVEYVFYEGLSLYKLNQKENGLTLIKQAIYSSAAANTSFFLKEINMLEKETGIIFEKIDNDELYIKETCDNISLDIPCSIVEYPDNSYSLNSIISDIREERGITLNKLSNGLLTVKSLHSYEKGTQKIPGIIVETLLERLGISADLFTIYGKAREVKHYNLRRQISQQRIMTKEEVSNFLCELKEATDFNNSVESQFYKWACYKMQPIKFDSVEDEISYLKQILSITIPDFDIYEIQNYLLSQHEFKLILTIAQLYLFEDKKKMNEGIYYLEQLLQYLRHNPCDIMQKIYTEGVLLIAYIKNTYKNNANIPFDYEDRFLKKESICCNLKYVELVYFYYLQTYNGILLFHTLKKGLDSSDEVIHKTIFYDEESVSIIKLMKRYYSYACHIGDLLKSINPGLLNKAPELALFRNHISESP